MIVSEKEVKTGKPHVCWGCCETFPKGLKMQRVVSRDLKKLSTVYWCDSCQTYIDEKASMDEYYDVRFPFGYVREDKAEMSRQMEGKP